MQTRRAVLRSSLALAGFPTLDALGKAVCYCEIVSEPTCLSQESAQGFQSVISELQNASGAPARSNFIVLAGASSVTAEQATELSARARAGAWVIWETSPSFPSEAIREQQFELLRSEFGILCGETPGMRDRLYVRYLWPHISLMRTFLACTALAGNSEGVIAHYGAHAIAAKRALGQGGVVFLGSMLGPHLRAGDREAGLITRQIFNTLG